MNLKNVFFLNIILALACSSPAVSQDAAAQHEETIQLREQQAGAAAAPETTAEVTPETESQPESQAPAQELVDAQAVVPAAGEQTAAGQVAVEQAVVEQAVAEQAPAETLQEKNTLPYAVEEGMLVVAGAIPAGSTTNGSWGWDNQMMQDGAASHTQEPSRGIASHGFKMGSAIQVDSNSTIVQYVYIDPQNQPLGIMVKLIFTSGKEENAYWEGVEEAFLDTPEYLTAWYMGSLPEKGKWQKLVIDCGELEIKDAQLEGFGYAAAGGRAWWGKTIVTNKK